MCAEYTESKPLTPRSLANTHGVAYLVATLRGATGFCCSRGPCKHRHNIPGGLFADRDRADDKLRTVKVAGDKRRTFSAPRPGQLMIAPVRPLNALIARLI